MIIPWLERVADSRAISYVLIVIIAVIAVLGIHCRTANELDLAMERYRKFSATETRANASALSTAFKQFYQGIRTVSVLPGVKNIDRHGKSLSIDAREAIIQIYDNMYANVAVSEIYISPLTLEPERIDPVTGGLEEPIAEFDGHAAATPDANREDEPKITTVAQAMRQSEVEIYEYRRLKEQMTYLRRTAPVQAQSQDAKLNVPFISGRPVLTCDNSEYNKTRRDVDRTGMVFSVPFYGPDGKLKGTVANGVKLSDFPLVF